MGEGERSVELKRRVARVAFWCAAADIAALAIWFTLDDPFTWLNVTALQITGVAALALIACCVVGFWAKRGWARLLLPLAAAFVTVMWLLVWAISADQCGDEVLFGRCELSFVLSQSIVMRDVDWSPMLEPVDNGNMGATGQGADYIAFVGPGSLVRPRDVFVPEGFELQEPGIGDPADEPIGTDVIARWKGPDPVGDGGGCALTLDRVKEVDETTASFYRLDGDTYDAIARGDVELYRLIADCIDR